MIAKVSGIYRPMFKTNDQKNLDDRKQKGSRCSFKDLLAGVLKKSSIEKV